MKNSNLLYENGLPAHLEAETYTLGSVFLAEENMHGMRTTLEHGDFSIEKHRRIWASMCRLYDSGTPVDRVTVAEELKRRGELESCDGITYLCSLDDGLPHLSNLDTYVRIVKEKSALRRVIYACQHTIDRALVAQESAQCVFDGLSEQILLHPATGGKNGPISAKELVSAKGLDALLSPRRNHGIRLPWKRLDTALCGLHPDQLVLLAAHTRHGKTSFALQVATHAAEQGAGVLIFSLEMDPGRLFRRMVNQISGLDYDQQRNGSLFREEREAEIIAANWICERPIYFDESSFTVAAMHAAIRQTKLKHQIGLVVVDYLQLIRGIGRQENRAVEVGANSRALKLAAKEFHLPFLVLSQFNRESAKEGRKPEIHDLKASGDIENDSDVVLLLRPDDPKDNADVRRAEINVAKQREGPSGMDIPLMFHSHCQRFKEA